MNDARTFETLQVRLDQLLDRLERMMNERDELAAENAELRRTVEALRTGWQAMQEPEPMLRSSTRITPVGPIANLSRRGARLSDPDDPGAFSARDGHSVRDTSNEPVARPEPLRAGAFRTERIPIAAAPMVRTDAPLESQLWGPGLQPEEQGPVTPHPDAVAPRHNVDLGYINRVVEEDLDKLPYGLIVLDVEGRVLFYNETESRYAGFSRERVLGKNFFGEVAPCTRVQEFEGAFRQFVAGKLGRVHFFDFVFHFKHGSQTVLIGFSPGRQRGQVNVMLTRR